MNPTDTVKTFSALCEEFVELFMRHHPVAATAAGIHDYDDRYGNDTPEGLKERAAWLRDLEQRLVATVPWDDLPLEQRVEYGLLRARTAALRADLEEIRAYQRNPALYTQNALEGVHLLMMREFAPLEERKEAVIARLLALPDYLEKVRQNLKDVPELFARVAAEANMTGPTFVDEVTRTLLRRFPGEAERIEHAGERARLGFLRLQEFLERDLQVKEDAPLGIGERWMDFKLEREHMLPYDCDALAALGRQHVDRTLNHLVRVAKRVAPGRTWQEALTEARKNHPPANRLRDAYEAEVERARQFIRDKGLVPLPQEARIEVVDTPVFERHTVPYAAYLPPAPFDAEQVGYFYVTPVDASRSKEEQEQQLQAHNLTALPLTTVHETYPGHHVQLCLANRAAARLRRLGDNSVLCEGWALYCEELMHEHGFYTDPLTQLYQLRDLLWRACRVVIDVELQRGQMTFPQAVDFLVEKVMLERPSAEAEVKRYAMTPTQPMSYLVGKLQILELKNHTQQRLGTRFNLRDFHAALLASGSLPLSLIAEELAARLT